MNWILLTKVFRQNLLTIYHNLDFKSACSVHQETASAEVWYIHMSPATLINITRGMMVVVVVTGQVMVWPGDALGPYDHLLPTDQWPLALGSPHSPHHIIIWSSSSFSTSARKGFPMTCSHCIFFGLPPLDVYDFKKILKEFLAPSSTSIFVSN